jgi:hypothetical protein
MSWGGGEGNGGGGVIVHCHGEGGGKGALGRPFRKYCMSIAGGQCNKRRGGRCELARMVVPHPQHAQGPCRVYFGCSWMTGTCRALAQVPHTWSAAHALLTHTHLNARHNHTCLDPIPAPLPQTHPTLLPACPLPLLIFPPLPQAPPLRLCWLVPS